jgi:hypothetical protein
MYCSLMAPYSSCPAVSSTSSNATSSSMIHCFLYESSVPIYQRRISVDNAELTDSWIIPAEHQYGHPRLVAPTDTHSSTNYDRRSAQRSAYLRETDTTHMGLDELYRQSGLSNT